MLTEIVWNVMHVMWSVDRFFEGGPKLSSGEVPTAIEVFHIFFMALVIAVCVFVVFYLYTFITNVWNSILSGIAQVVTKCAFYVIMICMVACGLCALWMMATVDHQVRRTYFYQFADRIASAAEQGVTTIAGIPAPTEFGFGYKGDGGDL